MPRIENGQNPQAGLDGLDTVKAEKPAELGAAFVAAGESGHAVSSLHPIHTLNTGEQGCYDITAAVKDAIRKSGVDAGLCVVYCPHTTAGITINENADPDVVRDLLYGLEKAFPDRAEFRHSEGNSAAHLKASCIGSSVMLIVENGAPELGTWQGIYFCEFDGPRERRYHIKVISG